MAEEIPTYAAFVAALKKSGEQLCVETTSAKADANHMVIGLVGEAGELVDAVKRWTVYNKALDRDNVVEELGDIEFYLEGLRQRLGIHRDETIQANIKKLSARYYQLQYTDAQAHERADKAVQEE